MIVEVYRLTFGENSTQGLLAIDGVSKFSTLEPPWRSEMLMPVGTYRCKKTMSPRMQYVSPELQNVPGHVGERIHIGNEPSDTHGCILLGMTRAKDWVGDSRAAFDAFMAAVPDEFDLTITQQPNEAEEISAT